jgi:hypothetical protein
VPSAGAEVTGARIRISRSVLETVRRELRALPEADRRSPLRAVVGDLYELIREKREQGMRWAAIHQTMNKQFPITLKTLMMYFAEEEHARKRKGRSKPRSR